MSTQTHSFELRHTSGAWTSFRQQLRLLGWSRRWLGAALSVITLMVVADLHVTAPVPVILHLGLLMVPIGAIWAVVVWTGEGPSQRGYHWSLPVRRPAHDLMRVLAGGVHLVAICAAVAVASAALALAGGTQAEFIAISAQAWASYFVAPLVAYVIVSPIVLWRDYAVTRRLLLTLCFVGMLTPLAELRHIHFLADAWEAVFFGTEFGLGNIANGQLRALAVALENTNVSSAAWQPAAALWMGIGVALTVFTARFRPDDLARSFRRGAAAK